MDFTFRPDGALEGSPSAYESRRWRSACFSSALFPGRWPWGGMNGRRWRPGKMSKLQRGSLLRFLRGRASFHPESAGKPSSFRERRHARHPRSLDFIAKRLERAGLPAFSSGKDAQPVKKREQAPALLNASR
jgi:hypothetical protein